MKYLKLHAWNIGYKKAVEIPERLKKSIIMKGSAKHCKLVAGADVSYTRESNIFYASVVVFNLQTMERVEEAIASGKVDFSIHSRFVELSRGANIIEGICKD